MTKLQVFACVLLVSATAHADARLELFDDSGRLVYLGSQQERMDGTCLERVVRYCHPDGRLVLETRARFDAASRRVLSSQMTDGRSGKTPAMNVADEQLTFTSQDDAKTMPRPPLLHVPEGLGDVFRARWDELSAGKPHEFTLALPRHARTLQFRLVRDHETEVAVVVRLEPANWVIRRLAKPVFFHVAKAAPHRVLETRGPSAVTDAQGDLQSLRAVYAWIDPRPLPCTASK